MKILAGAAFLVMLCCSLAGAQQTHITMKNGASFDGFIVQETDSWIDLELGTGRIRLQKRRIRKRQDLSDASSGNKVKPLTSPLKKLGIRPDGTDGAKAGGGGQVAGALPIPPDILGARIGEKAGNSATSLNDAPLPRGTPEHAVASFLRLAAAGHVQAAVQHWVEVDHVLDEFFPAHAPSLTRYSRRRASESWARILRMVFSDPKFMTAIRREGIQVRTVRETGDRSLVEVSIPINVDKGNFESYLLGVQNNRIVEFGQMLFSLKKVCNEMSSQLAGTGSWVLVPLLDKTAERVLAMRRDKPHGSVTIPIPTVSELREARGSRKVVPGAEVVRRKARYRLTVPPTWKRVAREDLPKFADMMVQSRSRKAFAMVLVEPEEVALSALERAARANLNQVADKVRIDSRRMVQVPHGKAVRFNAQASIVGIPLLYEYHLVATKSYSYQLICWCHKSESNRFESVLEQIVQSFDVMPDTQKSKEPGEATAGNDGPDAGPASGSGGPASGKASSATSGQGSGRNVTTGKPAPTNGLKERLLRLLRGGKKSSTGSRTGN